MILCKYLTRYLSGFVMSCDSYIILFSCFNFVFKGVRSMMELSGACFYTERLKHLN